MSVIKLVKNVSSFLRNAFSNQQMSVINGLKNKSKALGLPYFRGVVIFPRYRPF